MKKQTKKTKRILGKLWGIPVLEESAADTKLLDDWKGFGVSECFLGEPPKKISKKAEERKSNPIFTGVLAYFPDALAEVCKASLAGNKQHLEGEPLHWDRTKSKDQMDSLTRHLIDCAKGIEYDDDGVRHLAKVCWRALAQLQIVIEKENETKKK